LLAKLGDISGDEDMDLGEFLETASDLSQKIKCMTMTKY
jgi:hypothetical protein